MEDLEDLKRKLFNAFAEHAVQHGQLLATGIVPNSTIPSLQQSEENLTTLFCAALAKANSIPEICGWFEQIKMETENYARLIKTFLPTQQILH